MPGSHPPVQLRLEPHALPMMRTAFEEAISEVQAHVTRLGRIGFIPDAWLGDPVSATVQEHYNAAVMEAADGPYAAPVAYEAELVRICDSLQLMEDHYRRTEGDNAARWGRV
jgi:hypothetical protein